jgi:glutamate transport system permease protein
VNNSVGIFEIGGPKQRRRIRAATIISGIIIIVALLGMLQKLHYEGQLIPVKWETFYSWPFIRYLLEGLLVTLKVAASSVILSSAWGILLALGRISRSRVLRAASTIIVEFFRGMPFLLIIFVVMFGLPPLGLTMPPYWQLVLSITLVAGAMFAEIFRAGILDLPIGQTEAGLANGLTQGQTFTSIILPQAVRNLTPALLSQCVRVIKESSLGYVVGVAELVNNAKVTGEFTGNFIQAYLAAAVIFIIVNALISFIGDRLARRL